MTVESEFVAFIERKVTVQRRRGYGLVAVMRRGVEPVPHGSVPWWLAPPVTEIELYPGDLVEDVLAARGWRALSETKRPSHGRRGDAVVDVEPAAWSAAGG